MVQYIFIIGATGKVGSTLVKQIFEYKDDDFRMHTNPTKIMGLASSKEYILSKDGLNQEECLDFAGRKSHGKSYDNLEDLIFIAKENSFGVDKKISFIDATASIGMEDFHMKISEDPMIGLVTANKNPLALCDYNMFELLTRTTNKYGYRCSVMAGAEAVSLLQDLRDVNDIPTKIYGCFSGTLGFICTELENGKKLSSIIAEAKEKGYTEPHPKDDLNGLDVARKLLILARTAGYKINMGDIAVDPFLPQSYLQNDNVDEFIQSIKELDAVYENKIIEAMKENKVLRYIARLSFKNHHVDLKVGLEKVPKESPLGMLKGTSNKITVISRVYPEEMPYVVEAPGAGLEITAQNIRRDLLYQLHGRSTINAN